MTRTKIIVIISIILVAIVAITYFVLNKYFKIFADTTNPAGWTVADNNTITFTQGSQTLTFTSPQDGKGNFIVGTSGEDGYFSIYTLQKYVNYQPINNSAIYLVTTQWSNTGNTAQSYGLGIFVNDTGTGGMFYKFKKTGDTSYTNYTKLASSRLFNNSIGTLLKKGIPASDALVIAANQFTGGLSVPKLGLAFYLPNQASSATVETAKKTCLSSLPQKLSSTNPPKWPAKVIELQTALNIPDIFEKAYNSSIDTFKTDDNSLYDLLISAPYASPDPTNYRPTEELVMSQRNNALTESLTWVDNRDLSDKAVKAQMAGDYSTALKTDLTGRVFSLLISSLHIGAYTKASLQLETARYYMNQYVNFLDCISKQLPADDPAQANITKAKTLAASYGAIADDNTTTAAANTANDFWNSIYSSFMNIITNLMKQMMIWAWSLVSAAPL